MFREWGKWRSGTVVVMASGPSMDAADALRCRGRSRVITVNSTWKHAPWADAHYSSDADWWAENLPAMRRECEGEFWTGHPHLIASDVRNCPYHKHRRGVSSTPGALAWGGNSGYCAMGLAYQFGARRIMMLGFDMQEDAEGRGHWHPDHPDSIRKDFNFPMWRQRFAEMATDFRLLGVEVINCSRETSLTMFPRRPLSEVI